MVMVKVKHVDADVDAECWGMMCGVGGIARQYVLLTSATDLLSH